MKCPVCGTGQKHEPCEDCGKVVHVGADWKCPHDFVQARKGFEAFYDEGLGQTVTGFGDINAACRPKWDNDHVIHIQPRDKSPQYFRELNERRAERAEASRRNR